MLIEKARAFAEERHSGTFRLNGEPFINHPREVAELIRCSGGSNEEIAAGWLHDTVEDTPTTLEEIEKLFGSEVKDIVNGLTDPPEFKNLPLAVRKARQAERVRSESANVKRVKIADQISNIRSLDAPTWSKQKRRDYLEGARLVAKECKGVDDYLDSQFELAYMEAKKSLASSDLEVIEDTAGKKIFTPDQLELAPALPDGLKSNEAIRLARCMGANLGQFQGEHVLKKLSASHIPFVEWEWMQWRQYYFILPGTKLKDSRGYLYIPYIHFSNGRRRWEMGARWLYHAFLPPARLLRPRE